MNQQQIAYFFVLGFAILVGLITLAWPKKKEKK